MVGEKELAELFLEVVERVEEFSEFIYNNEHISYDSEIDFSFLSENGITYNEFRQYWKLVAQGYIASYSIELQNNPSDLSSTELLRILHGLFTTEFDIHYRKALNSQISSENFLAISSIVTYYIYVNSIQKNPLMSKKEIQQLIDKITQFITLALLKNFLDNYPKRKLRIDEKILLPIKEKKMNVKWLNVNYFLEAVSSISFSFFQHPEVTPAYKKLKEKEGYFLNRAKSVDKILSNAFEHYDDIVMG